MRFGPGSNLSELVASSTEIRFATMTIQPHLRIHHSACTENPAPAVQQWNSIPKWSPRIKCFTSAHHAPRSLLSSEHKHLQADALTRVRKRTNIPALRSGARRATNSSGKFERRPERVAVRPKCALPSKPKLHGERYISQECALICGDLGQCEPM
jgi:hypothetical protein